MRRPGNQIRIPRRELSGRQISVQVFNDLNFNPNLLNPDLWLDASDTTTITESSGAVSQWNDKSGNGRHFTQATAASQPTTNASTLNNKNVIDFATDYLVSNQAASVWKFLHDGTDYIIALVFRPGNVSNPAAFYGIIGTELSSGQTGFGVYYNDSGVNDRYGYDVCRGSAGTYSVNVAVDNYFTANTWCVFTLVADPDNATAALRSSAIRNFGQRSATNTRTSAPSSSNSSQTLVVGANRDVGAIFAPMTGAIAEVVIVSGAQVTENNRLLLHNYLENKWGPLF